MQWKAHVLPNFLLVKLPLSNMFLRVSLQIYVWMSCHDLQSPLLRVLCSLVGKKTWITNKSKTKKTLPVDLWPWRGWWSLNQQETESSFSQTRFTTQQIFYKTLWTNVSSPPPILHLLFNTLISYIPVPWNYFPLNYFHPMFIN